MAFTICSKKTVLQLSVLASIVLCSAAADYQCGNYGTVHYTYRFGDSGGSETYAAICPTKSFVNEVELSTDSSNRLTEIDFTCSDKVETSFSLETEKNSDDDEGYDYYDAEAPSPAGSDEGDEDEDEGNEVEGDAPSNTYFSGATGYTGANNSDIVSQITFSTPDAVSFSAGSSKGYYTTKTLPFDFGLPANARIIGFNSSFGYYVDSIALIYCA